MRRLLTFGWSQELFSITKVERGQQAKKGEITHSEVTIDKETFAEHALQVVELLPGGTSLLHLLHKNFQRPVAARFGW
jgi:hypothetical protein